MTAEHSHRAVPLTLASEAARSVSAVAHRILLLLHLDHDAPTIERDAVAVRRRLDLRGLYNVGQVRRALGELARAGLLEEDGETLRIPGSGEFVCRRARKGKGRGIAKKPRAYPAPKEPDPIKTTTYPAFSEPRGRGRTPLKGCAPYYPPGDPSEGSPGDRLEAAPVGPNSEPVEFFSEERRLTEFGAIDLATYQRLQNAGILSTKDPFAEQPIAPRPKNGSAAANA